MIILGIDSSTTSTGWGVIDTKFENELRLVDYGSIKPPKVETIDRIIYITRELKRILQDFKPELIVIEEMNVTRNMNTIRALAGLITEIEVMLRNRQALYVKMTPSEWRKKVGIKCKNDREMLKKASIEYVQEKYNEKVSDDEADAICIAEAGSGVEVQNDNRRF
jgi:crossover junction endodeoxyribonuclease RuvC